MVTMVIILYKQCGHDGYHLLVLFDGNTGDVLKGELRSGNVYTSRQVVKFIGPVLKNYGKVFHQETPFYLRADSGLSKPGLYRTCGKHTTSFAIRLKANAKLYELAEPLEEKLYNQDPDNLYDRGVYFFEKL